MKSTVIIILTYNSRGDIGPCLNSVLSQSYKQDYDVVVVDNNSDDDTVKFVKEKYPSIKLIANKKNTGYAGGNNIGLNYALEKDYQNYILLNPDMIVDIDWLKYLIAVADSREDAGIIQSKVLFFHEKFRINTIGNPIHYLAFSWSGGYKKLSSAYQEIIDIPLASGSCLLVKKEVLKQIGVLDEKLFMYHEDVDFSLRAKLAGYNIILAPDSKAFHNYSFSFGTRKFYFCERNRLFVFFSYYSLFSIILFFPFFLLTEILMIIYAFFTGWGKYKLKAYVGLIILVPHILKKKFELRKIRQITDRQMMDFMSAKFEFDDVNNIGIKYIYNPVSTVYFLLMKKIIFW